MKKLGLMLVSAFFLLAAPSHPEYLPTEITFSMADSYAPGDPIAITVKNTTPDDVWFHEQGQCHRFMKIYDSYGNEMTISDPNMACTMEYRTILVASGETKIIDTWNQKVYDTCPQCTTEPCPLMESEAYPIWCDKNPHQAPEGKYTYIHAAYTTSENFDVEPITIAHAFIITNHEFFSDVPLSHWAYDHIKYLNDQGIATGYGDGTFGPQRNITRAEIVKMSLNAAGIPTNTYIQAPTPYDDVTPDHSLVYYIATAQSRGIIETCNCEHPHFYPDQPASRFFALQVFLNALGHQEDVIAYQEESPAFSDATTPEQRAYTGYAQSQGIVSGYGDGTFGPDDKVTRAEMAKIIHETLE